MYHPFYPCSISFDSFDCHLDYEDSIILNNLTDIIVDSTNFIEDGNGFFIIKAYVSNREYDSINALGIQRATLVYNYMRDRFIEKGIKNFNIYTNNFIGENLYTPFKPDYRNNLTISLKLNFGCDPKTLFKNDLPTPPIKKKCKD